jgi:hypothetical protein
LAVGSNARTPGIRPAATASCAGGWSLTLVWPAHGILGSLSSMPSANLDLVHAEGGVVFHLNGGSVSRLVLYFHRDRALSDLGLVPEE